MWSMPNNYPFLSITVSHRYHAVHININLCSTTTELCTIILLYCKHYCSISDTRKTRDYTEPLVCMPWNKCTLGRYKLIVVHGACLVEERWSSIPSLTVVSWCPVFKSEGRHGGCFLPRILVASLAMQSKYWTSHDPGTNERPRQESNPPDILHRVHATLTLTARSPYPEPRPKRPGPHAGGFLSFPP